MCPFSSPISVMIYLCFAVVVISHHWMLHDNKHLLLNNLLVAWIYKLLSFNKHWVELSILILFRICHIKLQYVIDWLSEWGMTDLKEGNKNIYAYDYISSLTWERETWLVEEMLRKENWGRVILYYTCAKMKVWG